jgi:outer membrane protein W
MKRLFIVFLLTAATVFTVHAQVKQRFSIGPTAGFGHSWLSADEKPAGYDSKFHSAYNVGVKLVYSIENHWGLSADLKYSSEGGQFKQTSDDDNKIIYRASYIRLPLQGIYFFHNYGDKVRPKISFGPSFGFLVGGDSKQEVDGETVSKVDSKDIFKGFDFGLNAAVGTNIRLSPATWLNADITYYHGLTNVAEASSADWKNRGLGLNVGVLWGIGDGK